MKNSKNLKTALTVVMMIGIFTALIMMIIDMCQGDIGWFYKGKVDGEQYKLVMDWNYAGIYLALMLVALVAWATKFCVFCMPAVKDGSDEAKTCLICNIFVGLGLVLAVIALFLPLNVKMLTEYGDFAMYEDKKVIAGSCLTWIGLPMAFIASAAKAVFAIKNK